MNSSQSKFPCFQWFKNELSSQAKIRGQKNAKMRAAPLVVENYDERYHSLNSLDILKVPCIKLENSP